MLRRASDLAARARERIRAAREHDPHAWPERDDDRAILVHDARADRRRRDPGRATWTTPTDAHHGPPLGSPEPGAPDVDGTVGPAASAGRRRAVARTARRSVPAG